MLITCSFLKAYYLIIYDVPFCYPHVSLGIHLRFSLVWYLKNKWLNVLCLWFVRIDPSGWWTDETLIQTGTRSRQGHTEILLPDWSLFSGCSWSPYIITWRINNNWEGSGMSIKFSVGFILIWWCCNVLVEATAWDLLIMLIHITLTRLLIYTHFNSITFTPH